MRDPMKVNGKTVDFRFRSWAEYVLWTESVPTPNDVSIRDSRSNPASERWDMGVGWDGALRMARQGWSDGAERVASMSATLTDAIRPTKPKKDIAFSRVGPGKVSIPRYISGHPKPWKRWTDTDTMVEADRGILTMMVNISASAAVPSDAYFRRGSAIVALIDCLETAGYRVELTLVSSAISSRNGTQHRIENAISVKHAESPIEPDLVAFTLCHPAMLRRLDFNMMEHAPNHDDNFGSSYGRPSEHLDRNTVDIYCAELGMHGAGDFDANNPEQWVRNKLAAQGVEIEA